jgi:hypothetical protein
MLPIVTICDFAKSGHNEDVNKFWKQFNVAYANNNGSF